MGEAASGSKAKAAEDRPESHSRALNGVVASLERVARRRVLVGAAFVLLAVIAIPGVARIHTSLGEELILMRLADALRELETAGGLQVHRSWWVSKAAIRDVKRSGGKVFLVLASGKEAPVSRTYQAEAKAAGLI